MKRFVMLSDFWGRGVQGRLLGKSKNGSREQGKATGVGFYCGQKGEAGVRAPA